MPSSLIELRPNGRLLDHDFEGYKLNLNALPHWRHELITPIDKVYPDEVQYSFLHAKLFALHNHLIADKWSSHYTFYYIDKKRQVRQVNFNNDNHSFQASVVYDIPTHVERKSGHFNICLTFPSSKLAVLSDGTGHLNIVATEGRNNSDQKWKTIHSSLVLGDNKYFVIIDCRAQESGSAVIIHCLLQSVEQSDKHFCSILTWVTFQSVDDSWKQISIRQLQGKGIIHYAAIETNFSAIYVASDNQFKFISDSVREIPPPPKKEPRKFIYTWLQTTEDVTVTLKLPTEFDKNLFEITINPVNIKVSYAGETYIEGDFRYEIENELTTWNIEEDGQVDILLTKLESMLWDQFLDGGDKNGQQIMDPSLVEETHKRLAHLCSEIEVTADQSVSGVPTQELEECDAASEEDTILVRLDVTDHEATHRVPLSVHQYLFKINIEPNETPALVLRHDVDACVWQSYAKLPDSDDWPIKHQGTLMAFGYIQSSKQNRKFVTCPPNFSYSVVCETSRHIFVYRNGGKDNEDCQLKKRVPGEAAKHVKVGQQHVINIDKFGEVFGIVATNSYLFVLIKNSLLVVEIN